MKKNKMGKCFFDLLLSFASLQFHKLMKSKRYERVNEEPGETARSKRICLQLNLLYTKRPCLLKRVEILPRYA